MNKKGMTLIEMITALAILTTASLMVMAGFMSVFRMLNQSNKQKDASDVLISFAEKSVDPNIINQVNTTYSYQTYQISNGAGIQAQGEIRVGELRVEDESLLPLRSVEGTKLNLISDLSEYRQVMNSGKTFYDVAMELQGKQGTSLPYDSIIQDLYKNTYNSKWNQFPSLLLPKQLFTYSKTPYNIVGAYPWDYITNNVSINHGGLLIYLSQNYKGETPEGTSDILHVVYDYVDDCWYYNPGNEFVVYYEGYGENEISFVFNGNNTSINSYEIFRSVLKDPSYNWVKLDGTSKYDPSNIDSSWRR